MQSKSASNPETPDSIPPLERTNQHAYRFMTIARLSGGRLPGDPRSGSTEQGSPSRTSDILRPLTGRPTPLLLHGSSRSVVNLALFAIAQATNPLFLWLDARDPGEQSIDGDPVALGWVPREQQVPVARPEMFAPHQPVDDRSVSRLIREDEPRPTVDRLLEFVQLPEVCQQILPSQPAGQGPGLIAMTDADRVMAAYTHVPIGPMIHAHTQAGYSLFIGYSDVSGPGQAAVRDAIQLNGDAFEYVLRVDATTVSDWEEGRLVCEKGAGPGTFETGSDCAFTDLPFMADVFRRASSQS